MIESFKLPVITKETVSGSVASFNSEYAGLPLDELIVDIPVTQEGSGTPSPYNVRPIVGYSAINIGNAIAYDTNIEQGTLNNSGLNGDATNRIRTADYIPVVSGHTYKITLIGSGAYYLGVSGYTANDYTTARTQSTAWLGNNTDLLIDAGVNYIRINVRFMDSSNITPADLTGILVTDITNYFTIQIGSKVYAGTLDVLTGVLTVTHGIVDLGSLNWLFDISDPSSHFTSLSVPSGIKLPSTYSETANIICSNYDAKSWESAFHSAGHSNEIAISTGGVIGISDRDTSSPDSFKTAMNGVPLVYELAAPTTIQLTPAQVETIVGQNNIFADTGDTEVKFLKVR